MSYLLNSFRFAAPPGGGNIQFVGGVLASNTSATVSMDLTALTGGIGTTALDGDLVIAFGGKSHSVDIDVTMSTAGYTEIADLYANDTQDTNLGVFYKFMTATPDTTAVLSNSATSTNSGAGGVFVFRGVDPTTPLDGVTPAPATDINGNLANPPSITPATAGAWIMGVYAGANDGTHTAATAPANMTDFQQITGPGTTTRLQIGAALKKDWTSGAFDPDAWTGTDNEVTTSWAAVSIVLRSA